MICLGKKERESETKRKKFVHVHPQEEIEKGEYRKLIGVG